MIIEDLIQIESMNGCVVNLVPASAYLKKHLNFIKEAILKEYGEEGNRRIFYAYEALCREDDEKPFLVR